MFPYANEGTVTGVKGKGGAGPPVVDVEVEILDPVVMVLTVVFCAFPKEDLVFILFLFLIYFYFIFIFV